MNQVRTEEIVPNRWYQFADLVRLGASRSTLQRMRNKGTLRVSSDVPTLTTGEWFLDALRRHRAQAYRNKHFSRSKKKASNRD